MTEQSTVRIERSAIEAARSGGGREAVEIVRVLRGAKHQALLAGGSVRDLVLGREPGDFDVATSATPAEVERLFPKTVPVGVAFGTIAVVGEKETVQVTTFRRDGRYLDARHPDSVEYGDPAEDARRRDFTVNGLLADPESGEVIDFVGGLRDLKDGIVRAIGEPARRFAEDALRILRLPRFATQLRFAVDPETAEAAAAAATRLHRISAERVRDELTKIFAGPQPGRGLALLDALSILPVVLPEVAAMKGVEQPPEFHPEGDVFVHTALVLDHLEPKTTVLAWAALLHDVGKPPTFERADRIRFYGHPKVGARIAEELLRRLRFSTREVESIARLVGDHLRLPDVLSMREGRRRLFLRRPDLDELLALHRADCLGCHGDLSVHAAIREARARLRDEDLRPPRLFTGTELIALGHRPGPSFGVILRALEEAQLEGEVTSREQAEAWVLARFPPPGPPLKSVEREDR